jgi:hypothetical protein
MVEASGSTTAIGSATTAPSAECSKVTKHTARERTTRVADFMSVDPLRPFRNHEVTFGNIERRKTHSRTSHSYRTRRREASEWEMDSISMVFAQLRISREKRNSQLSFFAFTELIVMS